MSPNQHTPGPWYVSGTGNHQAIIISEATGENIAVVYDGKANGPVLAAAPELLEAIKALRDALDSGSVYLPSLQGPADFARAAIVKAEGGDA